MFSRSIANKKPNNGRVIGFSNQVCSMSPLINIFSSTRPLNNITKIAIHFNFASYFFNHIFNYQVYQGGKLYPKIWIEQAEVILNKIYSFEHPSLKVGDSKIDFLLKLAAENESLKQQIVDLETMYENVCQRGE